MSMNKFLINIAVCAVSLTLTSVSYGADTVLRTPERTSAPSEENASFLNSARTSVAGSPMQGRHQKFVTTASTTQGEVIEALVRAENEIVANRKNVRAFLKTLAQLFSVDAHKPVAPHSETVKLAAEQLVSSIESYKNTITKLEGEKKALEAKKTAVEKRLRQWKVGIIVSGIVFAFIYHNVLNNGGAWFSYIVDSWNSFRTQ